MDRTTTQVFGDSLPDIPRDLDSVHATHHHVDYQYVRPQAFHDLRCLWTIGSLANNAECPACPLQERPEALPHDIVIIRQNYGYRFLCSLFVFVLSLPGAARLSTQVPSPDVDCTSSLPFKDSARSRIPLEAHAGEGHLVKVKADALVFYLHDKCITFGTNTDHHFSDLCMAGDVCQCFLHDAISRGDGVLRQILPQPAVLEVDTHVGLGSVAFEMPKQGWQKSKVIQHGWPEFKRHTPDPCH